MTIGTATLRELCEKAPPFVISAVAREAMPELLDRVEALERVAEAAKRLREVQRMHRVPRQANEGEALLELDNALRDAGYGG